MNVFRRNPTTFLGMINTNRLDLIKNAVQNGEDVNQVFTTGEIAHENISAKQMTPLFVALKNAEPHIASGIMGYKRAKKENTKKDMHIRGRGIVIKRNIQLENTDIHIRNRIKRNHTHIRRDISKYNIH